MLAIGLPWFILVLRLNPGLQAFFLEGEVRERVLGERGRGKPFWFLPAILVGGTMPWTAALAASLGRTVAGFRRPHATATASDDSDRFLLAWIVGPFLLFAFARSKLAHYLLPLMPFCAVAAARWIRSLEQRERSRVWTLVLASGPPILAWAAGLTAVLGYDGLPSRWITGAVVVTALSACSAFVILRKREEARPVLMTASMAVLTWAWIGFVALTAEGSVNFRAHASHRWIREALEAEAVRGVPIGTAVAAPTGDRIDAVRELCDLQDQGELDSALRPRHEARYLPDFRDPEGWEMHADRARSPGWKLDDLVARLRQPRRMFVLSDAGCAPATRGGARPAPAPDCVPRGEKTRRRPRFERLLRAGNGAQSVSSRRLDRLLGRRRRRSRASALTLGPGGARCRSHTRTDPNLRCRLGTPGRPRQAVLAARGHALRSGGTPEARRKPGGKPQSRFWPDRL